MNTKNKTKTDALRQELITGYFTKTLLKKRTPFVTPVSYTLILEIIDKKAKRVAFPPYNLPHSLKGVGTTAILNLCVNIHSFYLSKPLTSQTAFDKWFDLVANDFISDTGGSTSFGNAQKIINITLKHLYAYADKAKIPNFKYCHFTLDDITYGGFYKHNLNYRTSFYKKEINTTKLTKKWTKLNQKDYYSIQKEIRKYFHSKTSCTYQDVRGKNMTPFEAEFVIWDEYKI